MFLTCRWLLCLNSGHGVKHCGYYLLSVKLNVACWFEGITSTEPQGDPAIIKWGGGGSDFISAEVTMDC